MPVILVDNFVATRERSNFLKYYYHNPRTNAHAGVSNFLKDGISLSGAEPFSLVPPHDWGSEIENNREWQVLRNAFFHVDWLFQAYLEKSDAKWLFLACSNLVDWVVFNITFDKPNRAKWSDICTGLRAFYYAFALDRCAREESCAHFIPILLEGAVAHGNELLKPEGHAKSNHAIFQGLGLATLGEVLSSSPVGTLYKETGEKLLSDIMTSQYGLQGVHLEHSPYYHGWVLERLKRIADLDLFDEKSSFSTMVDACSQNYVHFFRPDGTLSEIGDSSPETVAWVSSMHESLLHASSKGKQGTAPKKSDLVFDEAGYLIWRDNFEGGLGKSHLICHAGHHMPSHKHDDDFTFEWSELGKRILVDSGKLSYDYNEKRDYVLSRRAHNVLEIDDGSGFDAKDFYGAANFHVDHVQTIKFAKVELPVKRLGCQLTRYFFLKHGTYLIVADVVSSPDQHTYKQWFHFPPESKVLVDNHQAKIDIGDEEERLTVHYSLLSETAKPLFLTEGQTAPLQGWFSPAYSELVPAPALAACVVSDSTVVVSMFEVAPSEDCNSTVPVLVKHEKDELQISFKWGEHYQPTELKVVGKKLHVNGPLTRQ